MLILSILTFVLHSVNTPNKVSPTKQISSLHKLKLYNFLKLLHGHFHRPWEMRQWSHFCYLKMLFMFVEPGQEGWKLLPGGGPLVRLALQRRRRRADRRDDAQELQGAHGRLSQRLQRTRGLRHGKVGRFVPIDSLLTIHSRSSL